MDDLVAALGLVLVIEGAVFALAPDSVKRKMAAVLEQPPSLLRGLGLAAAVIGFGIVWLVRG